MLSFVIVFAPCIMDAAIYFDNEVLPGSAEVGDESADYELPPELDTA